ncbi:hypothetical protein [Paenibacillus apiarius]|uniref:Uncharacterized protein n=1 Tax=Paenibacillus apiarius TaxID=46240 RepID=A0ABT4DX08_9BACL|nr:hypothetical protein [Paenibacillus apiarius]MCY9516804.1 hypothetical protein [Paenibacillus apiarius]MCY9521897.1 hypothetical protein [Paenibacillus apiarius]MCY9550443.1 hypothetical protein [Paenibacillus apiarius]MCY9559908.1 hypothetical protein [Paenibacillus apiarius]MCY9683408.1 hypothetical protein [Paenibacillus apiarius]
MKKLISKLCITVMAASLFLMPSIANGYGSMNQYHEVVGSFGGGNVIAPWSPTNSVVSFGGGDDVYVPWSQSGDNVAFGGGDDVYLPW